MSLDGCFHTQNHKENSISFGNVSIIYKLANYRNQSIYLQCQSIDWFIFEGNTARKKTKKTGLNVLKKITFLKQCNN